MKAVISLLVLSNLIIASAAVARDAKEALRDNLAFCSQFVIDDPDPRVVLNHVRDCCALSHNVRDCQMYDLGAPGNAR
jgi:hypothetical protein